MKVKGDAHRPGPLKQQNKEHKTGRHRSKSKIDKEQKGKTTLQGIKKKTKRQMSRVARKHRSNQLRASKVEESVSRKQGLGESNAPPFIVTVISLSEDQHSESVLKQLLSCDSESTASTSDIGVKFLTFPKFKRRFCFVNPSSANTYDVLDSLKIADTVLLVWPADGELDERGDVLLSCIKAHGLSTHFNIVTGYNEFSGKKREQLRKTLTRNLQSLSMDTKFYPVDCVSDALVILRQISGCSRKSLNLQRYRTHLLAEYCSVSSAGSEDDSLCQMKVHGFVRGRNLDVNSLIHITGLGDFQISRIELMTDPRPLNLHRKANTDAEMKDESEANVIKPDPSLLESLVSEVFPDPMHGEQTWPTEHDLKLAEANVQNSTETLISTKIKKVPAGTSSYQATWIVDDEEKSSVAESEDASDMSDDDDEDLQPSDEKSSQAGDENDQMISHETESVAATETDDTEKYDVRFDEEEEKKLLKLFREERENEQFPDEVDTPLDIPARIRFQRYRGLKSFRTSPWNPKENLPYDYARIFQFQNFRHTKKRVLAEEKATGLQPGTYVCIYIENVPKAWIQETLQRQAPIIIYGLLPHEHKMSVVNFVIRKQELCKLSVKSKDTLVFHVGYRRFNAAPIFSQHTNGDKFKFEKFLPTGSAVVASVYAPIVFPPCTVLVFKNDSKGRHRLVASGAVLDVNPNRVVVKRIILSGHPFKVNKRGAIIRYMFFNREDINWFKPVELRTKYGRRGHIREALGTHGHMKCIFDRPINSQDTVLIDLYKRVFPKWSYDPRVTTPKNFLPNAYSHVSFSDGHLQNDKDVVDEEMCE